MTYGIVAIVRDEADSMDSIARWLDIAPPDRWTICDTGSTDGTVSLIKGLGADVWTGNEWVNFGHNRTIAFQRARGTADWLLALDADMAVEIDDDFEPDPAVDAYMIEFGTSGFSYRLPLLLRGDLPWESRGPVHEYTTLPDRPYISETTDKVRITNHGIHRSTVEKSLWHARLLEGAIAENPADSRSVFYLAQTYKDIGSPRALELYERRIKMGGWDQEVFYAKFMRAKLLPTWPARMMALIEAWESRPHRLEPVHELVRELNLRGQHQAAYRIAMTPIEPTDDILFVHRSVWDYELLFERSIAMWWAGDRDESYAIMEELLGNPRLPANLREATLQNLGFREAA